MFRLAPSSHFTKKYRKLIRRDAKLESKIDGALDRLAVNPLTPKLKSHVIARDGNKAFSSSVTGDLRIIWRYRPDKTVQVIDLIDIGGHSGSNKVYQ